MSEDTFCANGFLQRVVPAGHEFCDVLHNLSIPVDQLARKADQRADISSKKSQPKVVVLPKNVLGDWVESFVLCIVEWVRAKAVLHHMPQGGSVFVEVEGGHLVAILCEPPIPIFLGPALELRQLIPADHFELLSNPVKRKTHDVKSITNIKNLG